MIKRPENDNEKGGPALAKTAEKIRLQSHRSRLLQPIGQEVAPVIQGFAHRTAAPTRASVASRWDRRRSNVKTAIKKPS
jgi:hypothetical protein